jgi:hypothetical protein
MNGLRAGSVRQWASVVSTFVELAIRLVAEPVLEAE